MKITTTSTHYFPCNFYAQVNNNIKCKTKQKINQALEQEKERHWHQHLRFPNPSSDYLLNEDQDIKFAKRLRYVVKVGVGWN